jgi:hypothetical protein
MVPVADQKDIKVKPKIRKTRHNWFNFSENLKEQTTKMAFLMLILKEFFKDF